MYDIFLSYSTKDRDRLQPLFGALEERGWAVFWDHRTIDIGDHWSKKINHAIRTSKCVLVVWSENSIESEWVLEEANIGKQRDVFLPIRIDDVIFPVGFTMRQAGDFVDWKGNVNDPQFIRLAEKVQELVERHHVEQTRLAKEKSAADQKAREVAERQRWLEESQARLAAEEAAKQKKLEQQRAIEQKAREEAERQAEQFVAVEGCNKEREFTAYDDLAFPDDEIALHEAHMITKLDLARAYLDMRDIEMARSTLEEVMVEGNDDQRREAKMLLQHMLVIRIEYE